MHTITDVPRASTHASHKINFTKTTKPRMAAISTFDAAKQTRLEAVDLSRKGSIDESIKDLVQLINSYNNYVTSSSCSGRLVVYCHEKGKPIKAGCKWLLVSHQKVDSDSLFSSLDPTQGDLVLKFEPFILHVQCRRLQDAQFMHKVAISSGFRNSGLTIGKSGKITLAVRSSLTLEVPLSCDDKLFVDKEYITFLNSKITQKFDENLERTKRFYENLQTLNFDANLTNNLFSKAVNE